MINITYKDFEKVEVRSGNIIKVELFELARKLAYRISVDFGVYGILETSLQATDNYTSEMLLDK